MTACLTPQEIARYRAGEMKTEEELLAIEAHFDDCSACRQSLLAELSAAAPALRERLTSPVEAQTCPEPALLTRYVEGRADAVDIELVRTHCEDCPRCAHEIADRIAARTPVSPAAERSAHRSPAAPPWRQRLHGLFLPNGLPAHPAMAACALILVAGMGALAVYRGEVLPQEARNRVLITQQFMRESQRSQDLAYRASLEHQLVRSGQLQAEQETRLRQLEARLSHPSPQLLPASSGAATLAAVEQAMATRRNPTDIGPRRLLALMDRETSQLRGGTTDPSSPTLLQPAGTLILEDRPTLRWKPGAGAPHYTVTVRRVPEASEADPNEEQKRMGLTATTWTVEKPLQRGKRYRWQVAGQAEGSVSPLGEFLVVDPQTAAALRRVAREYSGQHLTLGILYTKAGLLDAAEAELAAVPQADAKFAIARELLRNLHANRSPKDPSSVP